MFRIFILLSLLIVPIVSTTNAIAASDKMPFYWKDSYGRSVGTIPTNCPSGETNDAGLCYDKCKDGYTGVGPVCWQKSASYDRGVGIFPNSHGNCRNKQKKTNKQAGLCYKPCKDGYKGKGPVCWRNGKLSYGRGVGKMPICGSGKEKDAGLCYKKCKSGYKGVGPVCWGKKPIGYVNCGAGFARNKSTCREITAMQVFSTIMLGVGIASEIGGSGDVVSKAKSASANKAKDLDKSTMDKLVSTGEELVAVLKGVADKTAKAVANGDKYNIGSTVIKQLTAIVENKDTIELAGRLGLLGYGIYGTTKQEKEMDIIRSSFSLLSTITGIAPMVPVLKPVFDNAATRTLGNASSVIASYMYPVYKGR